MGTLWYCLVAMLIVGYVIFDGYDLGAGIVHLTVARTDAERRQVFKSIGPLWDGNEVWFVALGGTIFFAFPRLYASSFSGFYLPLMIVLWLLIFRGISLEFRSKVNDPVWRSFWDVVFAFASGLLTFAFGVALGNIMRGVGLDSSGNFFLPLWTDFGIGLPVGALDWYTLTVGLFALCTLAQHGALWVALRTEGELHRRARRSALTLWPWVLVTGTAVTVLTFRIQPRLSQHLAQSPWGIIFPVAAVGGLVAARVFTGRLRYGPAFLSSSISIAGMLASAAFGIFPFVLPSRTDPALALTIQNTLAGQNGLSLGLTWWSPGILLAIIYVAYVHWKFSGKVGGEEY